MSELLKSIANSVPNLKAMNIDLNLKGDTPNAMVMQGVLNIGQRMYDTKEKVIKDQISTNFKVEDMAFEKEWLSDPIKLRDPEFRKKLLESKNELVGRQQEAINEADLGKDVRASLSGVFKINSESSIMTIGKTMIEQENAVELEKRTSILNTNKLLINTPTDNPEERISNLKRFGDSADNFKGIKTDEEINLIKTNGYLEADLKKMSFDFEKAIVNPELSAEQKIEALQEYRTIYASEDNTDKMSAEASEIFGIDKADVKQLIEGKKAEAINQIDGKIKIFEERIRKEEIRIADKKERDQLKIDIEALQVHIKEKELFESKVADIRKDEGAINTSEQAGNPLKAINVATGENFTSFQFYSDANNTYPAYGTTPQALNWKDNDETSHLMFVLDKRLLNQSAGAMRAVKEEGGTDYDVLKEVILPVINKEFGDDEALTKNALKQLVQQGVIKDGKIVQMMNEGVDSETIREYAKNTNLNVAEISFAKKLNFINSKGAGASKAVADLMVVRDENGDINQNATDELKLSLVGMVTNGTLPFPDNARVDITQIALAYSDYPQLYKDRILEQKELVKRFPKKKYVVHNIKKEYLWKQNNVRMNSSPDYTEDHILKASGEARLIEIKAGKVSYKERKQPVEQTKKVKPKLSKLSEYGEGGF